MTAYLLVLHRPVGVEPEAAHTGHPAGVHQADGVAELIGDGSARCTHTTAPPQLHSPALVGYCTNLSPTAQQT